MRNFSIFQFVSSVNCFSTFLRTQNIEKLTEQKTVLIKFCFSTTKNLACPLRAHMSYSRNIGWKSMLHYFRFFSMNLTKYIKSYYYLMKFTIKRFSSKTHDSPHLARLFSKLQTYLRPFSNPPGRKVSDQPEVRRAWSWRSDKQSPKV